MTVPTKADHPSHAERDEKRTLLGGRELGEQGGDDGRAHAEEQTGDDAEHREDEIVGREDARNGEQAVHERAYLEDALSSESIGKRTGHKRAHDDADGRPGRKGALKGIIALWAEELLHDLGVRVGDDHVVISVEHHGDSDQEQDRNGEFADSEGVDRLGNTEFPGLV